MTTTAPQPRANIEGRTLRRDRWWLQPAITAAVLVAFVAYSTWRAFENQYYATGSMLSPFYSPCLATNCLPEATHFGTPVGDWWQLSPALIILIGPLGFRLTCYYYRKAYYRSFWLSPPACSVNEPHRSYTGETRFPLILQNVHRYFFYVALLYPIVLTYDGILAFRNDQGEWGHLSLGTLILLANAALLGIYTISCHSCRHIIGGRLNHFSRHPVRYRFWTFVTRLNGRHAEWAWVSLFGVALTDLYVRFVAAGTIDNIQFF
jgi:hypothetical protein